MAEQESKTQKSGAGLYIFLILLLIIALGIVYYLGLVKNNEKISKLENKKIALEKDINQLESQVKNVQTKNSTEEDKVLDKDLYAQGNEYFVFIENGTAYYKYSKKYGEIEADEGLKNILELDKNIKRVKIFNLGTDISDTVFLISNDGIVKAISRNYDLKIFEPLKDYKVEDIISVKGDYYPGNKITYNILLKDGTTKEVIEVIPE